MCVQTTRDACCATSRLILADVFPYDSHVTPEDVQAGLDHFIQDKKLVAYEADGKQLLQIINWWSYQRSAAWMGASRYAAPDGWLDRARFHTKGRQIKEINWKENGGFCKPLPNPLPSRTT